MSGGSISLLLNTIGNLLSEGLELVLQTTALTITEPATCTGGVCSITSPGCKGSMGVSSSSTETAPESSELVEDASSLVPVFHVGGAIGSSPPASSKSLERSVGDALAWVVSPSLSLSFSFDFDFFVVLVFVFTGN